MNKPRLHRGWWRPWNWSTWTWVLAILVSVAVWPLVSRWYYLRQVPDVDVPFDAQQFVGDPVPTGRDASAHYQSAVQMLNLVSTDWLSGAIGDARDHEHWDTRLDQWLADHASVLAQLEFASQCQLISKTSLNQSTRNMSLQTGLRQLAGLSEAMALKCERSGELSEAWRWHRVTLRLALHSEKMGSVIDILTGAAIRDLALHAIRRWASHPSLTQPQLQEARTELVRLIIDRPPLSETMRFAYLESETLLQSKIGGRYLFPEVDNSILIEPLPSFANRLYLWSIGQPDLSLRLLRQILINNLDQIDRPVHLRQNVARSSYPTLYELHPSTKRRPGQLTVVQLNRCLERPLGHRLINASLFFRLGKDDAGHGDLDEVYRMEKASVAMTEVVLAVHEFHRSNGQFPSRLQELIPKHLEVEPLDPMTSTGTQLNYRRDSQGTAIVWTVGFDGIDDGGDIDGEDPADRGDRIQLLDEAKWLEETSRPASKDDDAEMSK
jgi:hypothetical protein